MTASPGLGRYLESEQLRRRINTQLNMARHVAVQQALPNAFFDSIGLPRLATIPNA
jgi:hypothetical protein